MKIRETELRDFDGIQQVCNRNNLTYSNFSLNTKKSDFEDTAFHRFSGLWKQNPNWSQFKKVPIGWVMENASGKIVGTLSNLHSVYMLNGVKIKAGIASSLAVDKEYRGESLALISKFLFQKDVDLVINSTANLKVEKIFKAFKALPVPVAKYDEVLFWIIDYNNFVKQFLEIRSRFKIPLIHYPIAFLLRSLDRLRSKNILKFTTSEIEEVKPNDKRIDHFWAKLKREQDKLLAVRDCATLNWHFKQSFKNGLTNILAIKDCKDSISGYVILKRRDPSDQSFSRYQIVDLQVLSNNDDNILKLLEAAMSHCRLKKIDILEIVGFSEAKRKNFYSLAPYKRKFGCIPFLYKAQKNELKKILAYSALWDPCLYDGDASLG